MDCPRCGAVTDDRPECPRCGVVLAKARRPRERPTGDSPAARTAAGPAVDRSVRHGTLWPLVALVLVAASAAAQRERPHSVKGAKGMFFRHLRDDVKLSLSMR